MMKASRRATVRGDRAARNASWRRKSHGSILHAVDGGHSDATSPFDYTVPFYVVGAGIPAYTDLYRFTGSRRADPGDARPRYAEPVQPVRNGDAANAITALLGLPTVPGSFMHDLLP